MYVYAICAYPSSVWQRSRLFQGVSELGPVAPIWTDHQLLVDLAEFIRVTAIGFPPGMLPLPPSIHTPRLTPFLLALPFLHPVLEFGLQFILCIFSFGCSVKCIGRMGGTGYEYCFWGLLFDFQFCFGHIVKMHAISCMVETMNI